MKTAKISCFDGIEEVEVLQECIIEGRKCFVHKSDYYLDDDGTDYSVSDYETGWRMVMCMHDIDESIALATAKVKKCGHEKFMEKINYALAKTGVVNPIETEAMS